MHMMRSQSYTLNMNNISQQRNIHYVALSALLTSPSHFNGTKSQVGGVVSLLKTELNLHLETNDMLAH